MTIRLLEIAILLLASSCALLEALRGPGVRVYSACESHPVSSDARQPISLVGAGESVRLSAPRLGEFDHGIPARDVSARIVSMLPRGLARHSSGTALSAVQTNSVRPSAPPSMQA